MFWPKKDDPVNDFKNALMKAVRQGSLDDVKRVIDEDRDVPTLILGKALDHAVSQNQLKIADALLARGAQVSEIGIGTGRLIVIEERHDAFRLMRENGLDFTRFIVDNDAGYRLRLRLMEKNLECAQLRDELTALRTVVADGTAQPTQNPAKPKGGEGSLNL